MRLGLTINGFAQQTKVIALINKGLWCHVCKANVIRFENDIMRLEMENKDETLMLLNDLRADTTKSAALLMLKKQSA